MSLRLSTPCDCGECPYAYDKNDYVNCEYWCGAEEPEEEVDE